VLINAFGMTVELLEAIARELRDAYFVVSWDSRGIPSFAEAFPEDACDVTAHAKDLAAVLEHHGAAGAHLVGWCTGAQVALRFRALWPARVTSLTSLSGAFSFPEAVGATEFKRNIMYLMPRVAASRAHAAAYHRMLYGHKAPAREVAIEAGDRARVEGALLSSDQLVTNLTSAPFKDPESLYRYARLVMHLVREPAHAWADGVTCPVLILSGAHDTVAHPEESRELARRIPHAELEIGEGWDHFSLLHEPELARRVRRFLAAAGAARPPAFARLQPASRHVPSGYTHGIVVEGAPRIVYVAGQLPSDEHGVIASDHLPAQFARALDNVIAVVRDAGGEPADIASMRIYVTDLAEYRRHKPAIAIAWAARFGAYYPAIAIVEVRELYDPAGKVEIEAIAHPKPHPHPGSRRTA
jgi:pimeloyl-ACP methyl ester carboxylesterase/enamine deaminase RidA (YjgF/YER057c/UK114 family)